MIPAAEFELTAFSSQALSLKAFVQCIVLSVKYSMNTSRYAVVFRFTLWGLLESFSAWVV